MSANDQSPTRLFSVDESGLATISRPPAAFTRGELKAIIADLCSISDSCNAAFFRGDPKADAGAIFFCGVGERFRSLSIICNINVSCIIVQDAANPWTSSADRLSGINGLKSLAQRLCPGVKRWFLAGQSSGGYAALLLSRQLDSSIVVAFAPQTFDDRRHKHVNLHFPPRFIVGKTRQDGGAIPDLREMFFNTSDVVKSKAYILAAFAESDNPPTNGIWIDALHWSRLVDHPDVTVFLTEQTKHSILQGNAEHFAAMIGAIVALPIWNHGRIVALVRTALYSDNLRLLKSAAS